VVSNVLGSSQGIKGFGTDKNEIVRCVRQVIGSDKTSKIPWPGMILTKNASSGQSILLQLTLRTLSGKNINLLPCLEQATGKPKPDCTAAVNQYSHKSLSWNSLE
jgi:hypothetical protein